MNKNENPTDSNLVRHAIAELDRIGETSFAAALTAVTS
jgi:hypothetical protein